MLSALRQLGNRKLQTTLTVLGVAVGAAVFLMFGGFATTFDQTIRDMLGFYEDKCYIVNAEGMTSLQVGTPDNPLTAAMIEEVEAVEGVADVQPAIGVMMYDDPVLTGIPAMIFGGSRGSGNKREGFWGPWEVAEGRAISEDETGVAVAGADMAAHLHAEVGDVVDVRGHRIEIVGVMRPDAFMALDSALMLPIADAQRIAAESLPEVFQAALDPADLNTQAVVYVEPGMDTSEVSARIRSEVPSVSVMDVEDLRGVIDGTSWMAVASALVLGACILALLAGALPIVNTMSVSVADQTRQIGVKRALGASAGRIVRDVLAESAMIGALGGALGVAIAVPVMEALNRTAIRDSGALMLEVTPAIVVLAIVFSIAVGTLGGLYPAWRVSRMDPVDALAHE